MRGVLWRAVLLLYPVGFREAHGVEMAASLARLVELERERGGRVAAEVAWLRGVADVVMGGLGRRWTAYAGGRRERGGNGGRRVGGGPGELVSDVRYGVRSWRRQPVLAAAAVVTLGIGVGSNTAVFSLVNGLVLEPLPYPEADRLVVLTSENPARGWQDLDVSLADAWDLRAQVASFADLAVVDETTLNLTGGDRPERLSAMVATWNVFSVIGVEPVVGRGFVPGDDEPGAAGVVILSDGLWRRRFGGDRALMGGSIQLNGAAYTVIGVMPPNFGFLFDVPDAWVTYRTNPALASRSSHSNQAIARLAEGAKIEQAQEQASVVAARLEGEYPETNAGFGVTVRPLHEELLGDQGMQVSVVLMGAVAFVLLMACANVANLMLARGEARQRELAVRAALGAGRGRLVRQLVTESAVVAVIGGVLGVGLAYWAEARLVAALPANMPPVFDFGIDKRVLSFAASVSMLSVLLFGLAPALRGTRNFGVGLRDGSRAGLARGSRRMGAWLVVVQTALAAVLLAGGGVTLRSLWNMVRLDVGFRPDELLTLKVTPPASSYPDAESLTTFYPALLERLEAVPGVESAAAVQSVPLSGSNWVGTFVAAGSATPASEGASVRLSYVTPGYFTTMGINLVSGRDIVWTDDARAPRVAIVNRVLAERHLRGAEPIGMRIVTEEDEEPWTIVGVVENTIERDLTKAAEPAIYRAVAQDPVRSIAVVIRTPADPAAIMPALRAAVAELDPDLPLYDSYTMREILTMRASGYRLLGTLLLAFAVMSVLLGSVGVYGVAAYGVGRRTQEIGVRLAVGADRGGVTGMIVGEGLKRGAAGILIGTVLASLMTRGLSGLLVGVEPWDLPTYALVIGVLVAVVVMGTYVPARRATGLDLVRALSHD